MNKIRMHEIRNLPRKEIELMLEELLEEYENLRFQKVTRQLDNPLLLRTIRRDIARLKTVLREFDLGIREEKKVISESEESKS